MAESKIHPRFVELGSGKRIVILEEEEFHRLLDLLDAVDARAIVNDDTDRELIWDRVSKDLIENRIAEVRKEKGISQRALAKRMAVTPSTVSRWERKDANLTLETLRKIAHSLRCDVLELIS